MCSISHDAQESVKGHWHIPIAEEHESDSRTTWLCITRGGMEKGTTLRHDAIIGENADRFTHQDNKECQSFW